MLAVGIDDQDESSGRVADAGFHGSAVAFVVWMTDDPGAGGCCARDCLVGRTIVDNEDLVPRGDAAQPLDHGRDRLGFVERRNDDRRGRARRPRRARGAVTRLRRDHVANRKLMMSPSCTTYSLPSSRTSPWSRHAAIEPRAIR